MNNPEKSVGVGKNKEKFEENRDFFTSTIKCLEFCGRKGDWFSTEATAHLVASTIVTLSNCWNLELAQEIIHSESI